MTNTTKPTTTNSPPSPTDQFGTDTVPRAATAACSTVFMNARFISPAPQRVPNTEEALSLLVARGRRCGPAPARSVVAKPVLAGLHREYAIAA